MTPGQLRTTLAANDIAPVYVLESEDLVSRQDVVQQFLALVDEGLHAFNVTMFHGRDATTAGDREAMLAAVMTTARTFPMMAPRRVVVVHDADALLMPRRAKDDDAPPPPKKGRAAVTAADEFEAYLARPEPLTALVLEVTALDRTRRITKQLLEHAVLVDCGTLDTAADASRWIRARLDAEEMTMEPAAVSALLESTGLRLSRLRAELDKLVLYAAGEAAITAVHVRDVVMPVEEPGEDFALGKAIWNADAAAALREVHAQTEGGAPAPMILGQLRAAALRLRPDTRVKRALRAILDSDLAVKSSRGEPRYVLERLVVELCGTGGRPQSGWGR